MLNINYNNFSIFEHYTLLVRSKNQSMKRRPLNETSRIFLVSYSIEKQEITQLMTSNSILGEEYRI